jgi:hypothetical protein
MKHRKSTIELVCLSGFVFCGAVRGQVQGLVTMISQGVQTNTIQITALQSATVKSYWDNSVLNGYNGAAEYSLIRIQSGVNTMDLPAYNFIGTSAPHLPDFAVAGPATISLITTGTNNSKAIVTLDIEPAPFPPGRTVTVGAYSGSVQVTMEISTDLVNWTTAVNGLVYTNSPDARFFRIKLVTNASP